MSGRTFACALLLVGTRGGGGVWRRRSAGQNTHSVVGTFDGQDYNSGDHTRADAFTATHQIITAGTYEYVCGFHGGSMRGTVIVE